MTVTAAPGSVTLSYFLLLQFLADPVRYSPGAVVHCCRYYLFLSSNEIGGQETVPAQTITTIAFILVSGGPKKPDKHKPLKATLSHKKEETHQLH